MAAKNPRGLKVFNTVRIACLRQVKEILDFITRHRSVGPTSEEILEHKELRKALEGQFRRMLGLLSACHQIYGDNKTIFVELGEIVMTTEEAVGKALFQSEEFLDCFDGSVCEDVSDDIGEDAVEDAGDDVSEDTGEDFGEDPGEDVRRDVGEDVRSDGEEIPTRQEVPGSEFYVRRDVDLEIRTCREVHGSENCTRREVPRTDTRFLQERHQSSPEATETPVLCRRDNSHRRKRQRHPSSAGKTTVIAGSNRDTRPLQERQLSLPGATSVRVLEGNHEVCEGATPVLVLEDNCEVCGGETLVVVCEGETPFMVREGATPVMVRKAATLVLVC
jgi:hypothetical protein